MGTDKIRKYLIPNIPYLFILWAFLKLGTAYRLAAGNDFAHKLIGLGQTIGPAFADFAPGLVPLDWLVGIVGAVGFRLLIYFKSKNAKKFRRDAEYGSARWGTEKDIKPFVDPKFENNVILTGTEFLTMNTRPKIPANARNLNCCIIGSSGSGKTRFWLTPQLLQAHSSYVVVDPKGGVLGQVGAFLQKRGYKIKVFNSMKPTQQTAPVSACLAALPMPLTSCPLTVPATAALSPSWCTRSKPRFTFWRTKPLPEPISSRCGQKRWKFTEAAGSSWLSALPCSGISKNTSGILCRRTPKPG